MFFKAQTTASTQKRQVKVLKSKYSAYSLLGGTITLVIIAAARAIHITAFLFIKLTQLWGIDATFVPLIILFFPSFLHKINTFTYFDTFTRICQYFFGEILCKKSSSQKPTAFLLAESEGFEPSCDFTRNSISSRARYDHFDNSPCIF